MAKSIQTVPSDLPGCPDLLGKDQLKVPDVAPIAGPDTVPPGIVVGQYETSVNPAGMASEILKPAPFA